MSLHFVSLASRPPADATIHVYRAGTTDPVAGLKDLSGAALGNPFTPADAGGVDSWGVDPPAGTLYDVFWAQSEKYIAKRQGGPVTAIQEQAEDSGGTTVLGWTAQRIWQAVVKWAATATSVFKGLLGGEVNEVAVAVSPGAAYTVNRASGSHHRITLTQVLTLTLPANPSANQAAALLLEFRQNATGGHSVTWPSMVWTTSDGLEPDLTTIPANQRGFVPITNSGDGWVATI